MRVALYPSVLYGADFIIESIESVGRFVDAIHVVMMKRPWGGTNGVSYRNSWISWPDHFDETREKIASLRNPMVSVITAQKFSPWNRWGYAVSLLNLKDDEVVILDPDCVFAADEAARAFAAWDAHPEYQWASVPQVELWRTPEWQVERPRSMVSFHRGDLSLISDDVRRTRGVEPPPMHALPGFVFNLGFCVSESAMRWKHLTACAYSPVIDESRPNPDWFDDKWRTWHPERNNRNLEISVGREGAIPCAVPYLGAVPSEIVDSIRKARSKDVMASQARTAV